MLWTRASQRLAFSLVAALLVALLLATGCTSRDEGGPLSFVRLADGSEVVFITQNVIPDAVMDALFDGRVVLDAAGCMRLDSPDPATVVWPRGFTIAAVDRTLEVRDAAGAPVGRVGSRFALGGGEVPFLHRGIGVSGEDRARAESRCPGRFWVVGDVVRR